MRLPDASGASSPRARCSSALAILGAVWSINPDAYSAVALNDPMSGYCRFAFLFTGLILLGFAHRPGR